ncbi:divalent metal cation transporter [soil metagenome]
MTDTPRPRIALFRQLGPGLITGAADDDPSGIATYSQAGAQFGFGLLWTMLLTYPLMCAVQLMSAEIGRVTGCGLAMSMRRVLPRAVVLFLVTLLFVANTINIGADIAAMGAATKLVVGGEEKLYVLIFAAVSLGLQLFVPYRRYARILKWLTLVLLSYVVLVFMLRIDWLAVAKGLVFPFGPSSAGVATMVVAIFGTTISPYLFFWQSAEEVEEIGANADSHPLKDAPEEAKWELPRIRFDTIVGMGVSNVVALAVMIVTAATLHAAGKTDIQTAADAAQALKPVAGPFAFALFSLGIIGTGLLAIPVLAGSAAYAVGETLGFKCGLEHPPQQAIGFYAVIAAATVLGIGIEWSPLDPIKALFWSAVINGVVAGPILVATLIAASSEKVMGQFKIGLRLQVFGWATAVLMAGSSVMMLLQR